LAFFFGLGILAPDLRASLSAIATACFFGYFPVDSNSLIFCSIAFLLLLWINGMSNKPHTGKFIKCLACNNEFYIPINRYGKAKYCSRKCKDSSCTIRIKENCHVCNKEFEHISSRCNKAKYCSRTCYHKAQNKKGTITLKCKHCEKEFKTSPSEMKKRKYCSIQCTKKDNFHTHNYKYSSIRRSLLRKNKINKCERCNYSEFPQILGVHHKDRNHHNNHMSNLEILCPNCHSLEHMKHTPHGFKE
jgi:hypothetical protein